MKKIVLTGGPSGGKTTMLPILSEYFTKEGYQVVTILEAATILLCNGITLSEHNTVDVQVAISRIQITLEDCFKMAGPKSGEMIIFCDRGVGDNRAYCNSDDWKEVLAKIDETDGSIDRRYDGVIHLITAAYGADEHYRKENESGFVRSPLETARELDDKVYEAWQNHKKRFIIDNSTNFEKKVKRTIDAIKSIL